MVNQPRIVFLIASELLLDTFSETTRDGNNPTRPPLKGGDMRCVRRLPPLGGGLGWGYITALYHRHFFAVGDVERVLGSVSGFGEREQIDSVQHIRLALSVESHEAVEFGGKLQTRLAYIAII